MNRYDVAVIGGGIAGAAAAYDLVERASVVVLEAEQVVGLHSTGRSAAVFTECYGEPVVRRLAMASRPFLDHPEEGFDPLLSARGIVFLAVAEQEARIASEAAEQQALVPAVRAIGREEACALCPVLDPAVVVGGVFEPDAQDLDVHALHSGFLRGARERGGEVRTAFRVESMTRQSGVWEIDSGGATVQADVVVDAAGAWADIVASLAGVRPVGLIPKRRTAFTFAGPEGHRDWPMVVDLDERFYFKPEGPSVLGSPADANPVKPQDVRHREIDVAMGIDRIQGVTTLSIRSIERAWAGLRSFVSDRRPVNGWDDAVPGFYWLAGQGGFGIKTSPAMGRYAASMILDGSVPDDLQHLGVGPDELGVERLR